MRNLQLLYQLIHQYDGVKAELMVQHAFERISFVYTEGTIKSLDHRTGIATELFQQEHVIALDYVQLNNSLCLATDIGEIIQYNLEQNESEVVGLINDGIETMSWSPDQELVVIVTK